MKYIIFDVNVTCSNPEFAPEVIEIGAVKVRPTIGGTRKILSEFQLFINPTIHSLNEDTAEAACGEHFPNAVQYFKQWVNEDDDYTLCSWGLSQKTSILENYRLLGLPHADVKNWFSKHVDLKTQFSNVLNCEPCGIVDALVKLEMSYEGRPGRAIDDAINISKVFAKLFRDWRLTHDGIS